MPMPLPEGEWITVKRRKLSSEYAMPTMSSATDHYSIGYTISGDRKLISAQKIYSYHSGEVSVMPPYILHQTVGISDRPYESFLIKFRPGAVTSFLEEGGRQVFDAIYEKRVFRFSKDNQTKLIEMFRELEEEYGKDSPGKRYIMQGLLYRLLYFVWEKQLPGREPERTLSPLTPQVLDAIAAMEEYGGEKPGLEQAAQRAGYSASYFSRLFRTQTGKSYSAYLSDVRMEQAQILLVNTRKSISEIAQETGYCHGNYMCEHFKKKLGMSPSAYRRQMLSQ